MSRKFRIPMPAGQGVRPLRVGCLYFNMISYGDICLPENDYCEEDIVILYAECICGLCWKKSLSVTYEIIKVYPELRTKGFDVAKVRMIGE